jgi:hypothetical protein
MKRGKSGDFTGYSLENGQYPSRRTALANHRLVISRRPKAAREATGRSLTAVSLHLGENIFHGPSP